MRKTFKLFCAAAMAALAVSSCGKIWDELDDVQGQLNSIEARLDSLETSLNGQVATINTTLGTLAKADEKLAADIAAVVADVEAAQALLEKLDAADGTINGKIDDLAKALAAFETDTEKAIAEVLAKIAVVNVEKNKAGNYVLTFADGSTLEVAAADANANNTGLVTVVDGKWAVVGADGKTTVLDAEVHPDTKIDFKVEENTLFVSYDGGKTWEKTDVVVNDKTTINVVEDFKYTEGDAFVTITVGGKEYQLPLYEAGASLVLGRTDFFLRYGASKEVKLTAEGVAEYYVMSKPDGWKASLDGTTLTVVAPAKKTYEVGAAEAEGEILIHATTESGLCKVAKLEVETGEGLTLDVDKDGKVTINNAYSGVNTHLATGEQTYGFSSFAIGIMEASEYYLFEDMYDMTFVDAYQYWENIVPLLAMNFYNNRGEHAQSNPYVEGKYEIDHIETSISEMLKNDFPGMGYSELPNGSYVIFVAYIDANGPSDGIVAVDYQNINLSVEADEVAHNDITVNVVAEGADYYLVGGIAESPLYGKTLDEYMNLSGEGPWDVFIKYGSEYGMGQFITEFPEEAFSLVDYVQNSPYMYGEPLKFDETYYFWVMPIFSYQIKMDEYGNPDFSALDYESDFKPYVYTFKTNSLVAGAPEATLELVEENTTYSSVEVMVTPAEGCEYYYKYYTTEEYNEMTDAEIFEELTSEYSQTDAETWTKRGMTPGQTIVLCVASVSEDGKYSLVSKEFKSLEAPETLDETLKVTFGEPVIDYTSIKVSVTPETGVKYYLGSFTPEDMEEYTTDESLMSYMISNYQVHTNSFNSTIYTNDGETRTLVVVCVNEDGTKYNVIKKDYTSKAYPISANITCVLKTLTYDEGADTYTATFAVTGADKIMIKYNAADDTYEDLASNVVGYGVSASSSSYIWGTVTEGVSTVTFAKNHNEWYIYDYLHFAAYNVVDGEVASLSQPACEQMSTFTPAE